MSESNELILHWKRPTTVEFPKVWHTFKARDLNSDELVEYRIEDVPESKVDEVIEHMVKNYIPDEPVGQASDAGNDATYIEDYSNIWRFMIAQKVSLVCFKSGTDEIVGVNIDFVTSKKDDFANKFSKQIKSDLKQMIFDISFSFYKNYDPFEYYGVNEYLSSFGLSVDRKYRGRGIGVQLLATRKQLCKAYGLKFSQCTFSSDFSNRNADKAGFELTAALTYEDIIKSHPRFAKLKNIKSQQLTLKTLICTP